MTTPQAVAVVVPARDEQDLLPGCLASLRDAVVELAVAEPSVRCRVLVVLDSCRDGSAEVVARHREVVALAVEAGAVGVARAVGVDAADDWATGIGARSVWIANTDADSVVPRGWLVGQVRLAAAGAGLVVGTVQPLPADLRPAVLEAWRARHSTADGHGHVHGANLGFDLAAYRSVGGFQPVTVHEDVALVDELRRAGVAWVATGALPVLTSGRHTGRVPDGFAAYLDGLGA